MKRFYKVVSIEQDADGWFAALDGRPVPTPAKAKLRVTSQSLAQRLADEWSAQGEEIETASMPTMTFVSTAIDRVGQNRADVIKDMTAYAGTDLLSYWAERPDNLIARQAKHWQPLLDWTATRFPPGFTSTSGIVHVAQSKQALASVGEGLSVLNDLRLNAAVQLCQCFGSTILALAVVEGEIDIDAAIAAAFVEDHYQEEVWGYDKEAHDRIAGKSTDARALADLLTMV